MSPHRLNPGDIAEVLAGRAELHGSMIDTGALAAAFPHHRLEGLLSPMERSIIPVGDCRARPTPVFLISFNRGSVLKRTIAAILRLSRPTEIIVHDNGSTDPETLLVLDELDAGGIKVVRRPAIASADELGLVDDTIQEYFSEWAEPAHYVVSDCDVDLSIADPQALDVYDALLNRFRKIECVGPMLRIRDIPSDYPLFNWVMNRHIKQFWRRVPTLEKTPFGDAVVLEALIDTTFALHRAGEPFRRLKSAMRVYEPFEARHLDWYRTEIGGIYAETSSSLISHWNNKVEFDRHRDAILEHSEFYAVKRGTGGALEIYKEVLGTDGNARLARGESESAG